MAPRRGGISIEGLKEFRRELRELSGAGLRGGGKWTRKLADINKKVAEYAAEYARGGAQAEGGVVAKAAFSIVGTGTVTGARLRWGGRGYEFADGAFFGAKRYRRFRPWVGNSWELASPTEGPYGINAALAARRDEIGELYLDSIYELVGEVDAFYERAGDDGLEAIGMRRTTDRTFAIQ